MYKKRTQNKMVKKQQNKSNKKYPQITGSDLIVRTGLDRVISQIHTGLVFYGQHMNAKFCLFLLTLVQWYPELHLQKPTNK